MSSGRLFLSVIGCLFLLFLVNYFIPIKLYKAAKAAGININIFDLVGMRLRSVPPASIIKPLLKAHKAGLELDHHKLEVHYLAQGDVDRVVDALIAAESRGIALNLAQASAIDLAGYNVLESVRTGGEVLGKFDIKNKGV